MNQETGCPAGLCHVSWYVCRYECECLIECLDNECNNTKQTEWPLDMNGSIQIKAHTFDLLLSHLSNKQTHSAEKCANCLSLRDPVSSWRVTVLYLHPGSALYCHVVLPCFSCLFLKNLLFCLLFSGVSTVMFSGSHWHSKNIYKYYSDCFIIKQKYFGLLLSV